MKIDGELLLAMAVLVMMAVLAVLVVMDGRAHATACLSIDVPPQAVVSQHDGDTFAVFTFGSPSSVPIRVKGVDTPERNTKQPRWKEAREFTRQWLAKGPFRIDTCGQRSFDRIVGEVMRDGESLAESLKAAGLGK